MLNDTSDTARPMQDERESFPLDALIRKGSDAAAGVALDGEAADVLAAVCGAVLCRDRADGERQLGEILARGADVDTLIDTQIPEAARFFGAAWMSGGHSFAEVTIAVARLQGWLRDLDTRAQRRRTARDPFEMTAPEILLVVPDGSQHTLGAMVVMSRLRRLGALVRLSLGQDARSLGRTVRTGHYDMVALSAAGNEGVDFLAKLINSVRSGLGPSPYVVLGGEILNQYRDAPALVGADFGTSDPEEALDLCGLTTSAGRASRVCRPSQSTRGSPERVSQDV